MPAEHVANRIEQVLTIIVGAQDRIGTPPLVCGHLLATTAIGWCGLHPAGGLRCPSCAIEHNDRSPEHVRPCDFCGGCEGPGAVPPLAITVHRTLWCRRVDGIEVAIRPGAVWLWGHLALCESCHRTYGPQLPEAVLA